MSRDSKARSQKEFLLKGEKRKESIGVTLYGSNNRSED
jgi:hypothetical protein